MNIHGTLSQKSWEELSKLTTNGGWLLFAWLKREMEAVVNSYVLASPKEDSAEVDKIWEESDPDGYKLASATVDHLSKIGLFEDNLIEKKLKESITNFCGGEDE